MDYFMIVVQNNVLISGKPDNWNEVNIKVRANK